MVPDQPCAGARRHTGPRIRGRVRSPHPRAAAATPADRRSRPPSVAAVPDATADWPTRSRVRPQPQLAAGRTAGTAARIRRQDDQRPAPRLDRARWDDVRLSLTFDGRTTVQPAGRGVLHGGCRGPECASPVCLPGSTVMARSTACQCRIGMVPSSRCACRDGRYRRAASRSGLPDRTRSRLMAADAGILRCRHVACPTAPAGDWRQRSLFEHPWKRPPDRARRMDERRRRQGAGGYYLRRRASLRRRRRWPLWYGTGVEDLFSGGFCADAARTPGPVGFGAPLRHPGGTDDATSMYRWSSPMRRAGATPSMFKLENGARGMKATYCLPHGGVLHMTAAGAEIVAAHQWEMPRPGPPPAATGAASSQPVPSVGAVRRRASEADALVCRMGTIAVPRWPRRAATAPRSVAPHFRCRRIEGRARGDSRQRHARQRMAGY